jgi:amidase
MHSLAQARTLAAPIVVSALTAMAPQAAAAKTVHYEPKEKVFTTYCHANEPQARISPGDTVITKTRDAANDSLSVTDTELLPNADLDAINPQTGPFHVEGAEPGDTLVVRLESVVPNRDWGWGASIPHFGALEPEYKTAMITDTAPDKLFIWRFDREREVATLALPNSKVKKVEVPMRPFLGTIGVAPAAKECIASITPGAHGGNMDFNAIVPGTTLYLPVFEPGGLLMVGDGHAAQGDGELDGAAIETSMDVRFTVDLIKGKMIAWPRLETSTHIMSIGSTRPLIDAVRLACVDLIDWMVKDHGFDKLEANQLLGQAARIEIAQVVDPSYTAVCGLEKTYLSD